MPGSLPRRPRQHVLEALSRQKLERSPPPHMRFVAASEPEYGIDGTVEVFSESTGEATGIRFDVQLKSTDNEDIETALKVRLKSSTVNYFQLLERPVLICLFHASTDALYVKWFHAWTRSDVDDQRSVTFDLAPGRLLSEQAATELVDEARSFYMFARRPVELPLVFSVSGGISAVDVTEYDVLLSLRVLCDEMNDLLQFDDEARAGKPSITVHRVGVEVSLGGVTTVRLVSSGDYSPSDSDEVAADALVAVTAAFTATRMYDPAARVAEVALPRSEWAMHEDIPAVIVSAFARSRRIVNALDLSRALITQDYGRFKGLATLLLLPGYETDLLTEDEHQALLATLGAIKDAAESEGDVEQVAAAVYTMGNAHRSRQDLEAARARYEEVGRIYPAYMNRPYYWKELAGVYFLTGQYSDALAGYTRAIQLGDSSDFVSGLRADCLMSMGRYREAHDEFLRIGSSDPQWRLKQHATDAIIEALGMDMQDRDPLAAERLVDEAYRRGSDPDDIVEACVAAIDADALCSSAWFNLGVALGTAEPSDGLIFFLVAAITQEGDVEAWWNAAFCAMHAGREEPFISDLVEAAYRLNGENFKRAVNQWARDADIGPERAQLMRAVEESLRRMPEQATERPRVT